MSGPRPAVVIPWWLALPYYMLYLALLIAGAVLFLAALLVMLLWHGLRP